jgi:hypothetical protein
MTNDKKQEQEEPITIAKEDVLETFDKAGDPLAMWCILRGRGKPVNHHTDAEYDALQSQLADAKAKLDALETAKSVSAITHILEGEHIQEWNELEAENESLKAKLDMATIIIDEFHDRLGVPGEESYLLELTRDLRADTARLQAEVEQTSQLERLNEIENDVPALCDITVKDDEGNGVRVDQSFDLYVYGDETAARNAMGMLFCSLGVNPYVKRDLVLSTDEGSGWNGQYDLGVMHVEARAKNPMDVKELLDYVQEHGGVKWFDEKMKARREFGKH